MLSVRAMGSRANAHVHRVAIITWNKLINNRFVAVASPGGFNDRKLIIDYLDES